MAEQSVIQNLPPEYIQKAYTDLLKNVADYVGGAQPLPDFQLAGLSPAQKQARIMQFANLGFDYDPVKGFTKTGSAVGADSLSKGLAALGDYGKQAGDLYSSAGLAKFDPQSYKAFMNPFQDELIAEVNKATNIQKNLAAGQQTRGGVFGGSRGQIQSGMIDQGAQDTIGKLTAANFNNAMKSAMVDFQNQQKNQLVSARGLGALGLGMSGQYGRTAQLENALANQGVMQMMGIGAQDQKMAQANLDMDRANILQAQNQPMALYGFMSDILAGAPSTMGYQYQQTYGQPGSMFSNILGTGATLLGGLGTLGKIV